MCGGGGVGGVGGGGGGLQKGNQSCDISPNHKETDDGCLEP